MLLALAAPQSKRAKPNHTGTFKASAVLSSLNVPPTKASHMAKLNINHTGKNTLPTVGRIAELRGKEREQRTGRG